jgi:hypothetical protein
MGRPDVSALRWPNIRRPPGRALLTAGSDTQAWHRAGLDSLILGPVSARSAKCKSAVAENG